MSVEVCIQLLRGKPVTLLSEGQLPQERPRPQPELEQQLRFAVRLLFFEVCWTLSFLFVPLALRGNITGTIMRCPQLAAWVCTILVVPRLSYFMLSIALLALMGTVFLEALYIVLGFTDFDPSWTGPTKQQCAVLGLRTNKKLPHVSTRPSPSGGASLRTDWTAVSLYCAEIVVDVVAILLLATLPVQLHRLESRARRSDRILTQVARQYTRQVQLSEASSQQARTAPESAATAAAAVTVVVPSDVAVGGGGGDTRGDEELALQLQAEEDAQQQGQPQPPFGQGAEDSGRSPTPCDSCVICLSHPKTHLLTPCGHKCMCAGCAARAAPRGSICPICRTTVESVVRVFD